MQRARLSVPAICQSFHRSARALIAFTGLAIGAVWSADDVPVTAGGRALLPFVFRQDSFSHLHVLRDYPFGGPVFFELVPLCADGEAVGSHE